jgi:hypothetical protein
MIFNTPLRQPGLFRTPLNGRIIAPIDPDELSLDLQFAADKTLTARKGPAPTFTRASTATFVGSNGLIQSAAINTPRFDHDPVTLVSRGLLIEESRTNLYAVSQEFDNVNWLKTRSSIIANATTAPDGTLTADKLVEDTTATSAHTLNLTTTPPATPHTLSVFAKKGERTWLVLRLGGLNTFFNLDDGTIAAGSANSPVITAFGNGWYRCSVTSSAGTQGQFWLATNSTTTSYTGDGTSGLFLWGAQLEAGSFPTSYIPTTTASVVRSADVCSITGSDFGGFWNPSEGTIFAGFDTYGNSGFGAILTALQTTDLGKIQIFKFSSTQGVLEAKDNANNIVFSYAPTSSLSSGLNKATLAYRTNDSIGTINNLSSPLDTSVNLGTQDRLLIGYDQVGAGRRINGAIASVRIYKKRLSLTKLQGLTAP